MTNSTLTDLREALEADFGRARTGLLAARLRLQWKDSPGNRAAVVTCRARVDAVLDTYLEVCGRP